MGNSCVAGGVPHHVFIPNANRNSLHAANEYDRVVTNKSGMVYYMTILSSRAEPVRSMDHFGSLVVPVPTDVRYTFVLAHKDKPNLTRDDKVLAWSATVVVCASDEIPVSALLAVRNYAWDRDSHARDAETKRRISQKQFMNVN